MMDESEASFISADGCAGGSTEPPTLGARRRHRKVRRPLVALRAGDPIQTPSLVLLFLADGSREV